MKQHRRPELDTANPPGQIVNRPGSLERIKKLDPVNIYAEMRPQVVILSDASNASDAATPPTQWETRYKALVGALVKACEEADRSYTNNAVDTSYLRDILHRNS